MRRPLIEAALKHVIGHIDQSYVVLVGPRGAGKTRVVEAAVANKTGVLRVDVGGRFETRKMVYRAIVKTLGDKLVSEFTDFGIDVAQLFDRVSLRTSRPQLIGCQH